jgi:2-furoate---CoA ligase
MELRSMLAFAAERAPESPAVVDTGARLTYAELAERSLAVAAGLERSGVRHGDRVCVGMRNTADHVVTFLALQALGAVHVPFNFRFKAASVAAVVEDCDARAAIVDDAALADAVRRDSAAASGIPWIVAGPSEGPTLDELAADGAGRSPSTTVAADDLSVILYTSGTTGRPKGVPLTQHNAIGRVLSYLPSVNLPFDPGPQTLGAAPLYHTVGLHYVLCVSLYLGGAYHPARDASGPALLGLVEERGLSFLFGSPTLFHAMLLASQAASYDTSAVTHVSFGSAPMPPSQLRALAELFPHAQISEVYGTTEISVPFVTRDALAVDTGALRVTVDHRVRVIQPGGSPSDVQPPGLEGELIVDVVNDGCFAGYWNQPEKTAERVRDGWYYTGDAFRADDRGNYSIAGRLDDMFISGGENIQPAEIEQILSAHPSIVDIAVIGTPDERWGQVVTALVVCPDADLTEEQIEEYCRASPLADFKRPRRVVFVDAIERNPSGKVVRSVLRDRYAAQFA